MVKPDKGMKAFISHNESTTAGYALPQSLVGRLAVVMNAPDFATEFAEHLEAILLSPFEFAGKAPKAPKAGGKKNCTPGKSHFCQKPGGAGTCLSMSKKCGYKPEGDADAASGYVADKAPKAKKAAKPSAEAAPTVEQPQKPESKPESKPAIAASPSQYSVTAGEDDDLDTPRNEQLSKSLDDWRKQNKKLAAKDPDYGDVYGVSEMLMETHQWNPERTRALTDKDGNMQAAAAVVAKEKSLHVEYLATAPWNIKGDDPRRTKGAGTAMMEQLIRESKELGKDGTITLESMPGATAFYKKLGFEDLGQADGYDDGVRAMRLSPEAAAEFMRKRGVTDFSDTYLDELLALEEEALGAFCTAKKLTDSQPNDESPK